MSATETEAPTTTADAPVAEAEKTREQRFRWSAWVHYGDGALECDHKLDGRCGESDHFHAWIRLPNPFQHRDIQEKAAAAKARRLRALREDDSDARVTLELQLDLMRESRSVLIEEIVDKDFPDDYTQAIREVDALEDETWEPDPESDEEQAPPKLYAHIDQDREELARQRELDDEQRDAGEFERLQSTVAAYDAAVQDALKAIQDPRREALHARPMDELLEIVRRERIEALGVEAYLHTYNTWQMYVCTLKREGAQERVWPSIEAMKYQESSEVIFEVSGAFQELEEAQAVDRLGKGS